MQYDDFWKYYTSQTKLDYNFTIFFKQTPPYIQYDIEKMNIMEKIDNIIDQLNDFQKMVIKIYFWEPDDQMRFFTRGLGGEMEILKSYLGKKTPGVGIVYQTELNAAFLRTLLLCHFNKDFSRNPQLEIMPYCLVDNGSSYLVFELYDDRGYNIYNICHEK